MSYSLVNQKIQNAIQKNITHHVARLTWSRTEIEAFQTQQFRKLLQWVMSKSPYYRERCQMLDITNISLNDLVAIQPSVKQDVLDHWDEIICVPELTKQIAETHLEKFRHQQIDNPYFDDKYYVTATGGSSGTRGLFAWDTNYFAMMGCEMYRYQYRDEQKTPVIGQRKIAEVTAPTAIHASTPLFSFHFDPKAQVLHLAVDLPIPELCHQLNAWQPTHLVGYSTIITELAYQAIKGNLTIQPQRISTAAEPLDDEARDVIRQAWQVEVNNMWGSVEMGMVGIESDEHCGMWISEDMAILEPVDEDLRPVSNPKDVRRLLVTNLCNYTLPLIRYVIDDVIKIDEVATSAYRVVKTLAGRKDDWFVYHDHIRVHPIVFRHLLGQHQAISEYQVVQTKNGALIRLITVSVLDVNALQTKLCQSLEKAGLKTPEIKIEQLAELPRHGETGKLKRFIAR